MHFGHKTAVYCILKEIPKQVFQDDIQSQILYGYAEPLPETETEYLQENKFSASDIRDRPEEERAKITKALEEKYRFWKIRDKARKAKERKNKPCALKGYTIPKHHPAKVKTRRES